MGKVAIVFYVVLPLIIIIWSGFFIYMYKQSNKLNEEFRVVEELSEAANTKEELEDAWEKLRLIKWWHRSDNSKYVKISTIIQTKYKMLCKK